ncbi:uncharacterized protein [Procambarus clarkii]|uniref:uncharacterized protein isoform X4 n=1 Tax=Procambarus clarkii TaxID=6728 RepID=UPI003741EDA0
MDGVVNKCQVCTEAVSKYKCPKCRVKYCSVVCYKTHRQDECHASSTESDIIFEIDTQGSTSDKQILFPTDDTVMPKTLENLLKRLCKGLPPTLKDVEFPEEVISIIKRQLHVRYYIILYKENIFLQWCQKSGMILTRRFPDFQN